MELMSTRTWIAWFLIPALAVALQAQSSTVSIEKKYRTKDGKIVEERIKKSGEEAEAFDINEYVASAQKDEIVELKVSKTDKRGNRSNIHITGQSKAPILGKKEFTDQPGEILIIDRSKGDGLPLPPNARKIPTPPSPPDVHEIPTPPDAPPMPKGSNSIDINVDVDGLDDFDIEDPDQENRQVRIRINKNGQVEERIINFDRVLELGSEGIEHGVEGIERGLEGVERSLEGIEQIEQQLEDLGKAYHSSRRNKSYRYQAESASHHTACLGIYTETANGKKGARITGFSGYSPAEDGGMIEGDIITALDGAQIQDYSTLTQALADKSVGQTVQVTYDRDGKEMHANIMLKSCAGANNTACLGVYTDTYRQGGKKAGAQINEFSRISPARTAGLQEGDIIVAINDRAVKSEAAVAHLLSAFQPGDEVKITYQRNGKEKMQTVKLKDCTDKGTLILIGDRSSAPMRDNCDENDAFLGVLASITIETTGDETRRAGESSQGFLVSSVLPNSPAELAGLKSGDIITSIDNTPILSFDDLEAFMQQQKPGTNVDVRFLRDGKSELRTVQLKSCKDRNTRGRLIISERGRGDRERRTIIVRKPALQDAPAEQTPKRPVEANERSLNLSHFSIFPNPAQGKINVSFEAEPIQTIVSILDMSGRQLFTEEMNKFSGSYNREFDLSDYTNTTLVIRITQGAKAWSERIVIAK